MKLDYLEQARVIYIYIYIYFTRWYFSQVWNVEINDRNFLLLDDMTLF